MKRTKEEQLEEQYSFRIIQQVITAIGLVIIFCALLFIYLLFGTQVKEMFQAPTPLPQEEMDKRRQAYISAEMNDPDKIENGIHVMTGLVAAEGWQVVRGTCTACHSAQLVTQNRATREGWTSMIEWMQATQGLWDLGENEKVILDYLATNYAPEEEGRRKGLDVASIEWYVLELD